MSRARLQIATAAAVALATAALGALTAGDAALGQGPPPPGSAHPWAERVAEAKKFAARRRGEVGFAVVDEQGELRTGSHAGARFESASVVKVMLMCAYLRQGSVRDRDLDGSDRALLGPMIRKSANGPASTVYQRVGAGALHKLARDAGMNGFETGPLWGGSLIRPADQAEFLYEFERHVPDRHIEYALGLMADIVKRQRWGIPPEIPQGWRIHFKGGWAPEAAGWKINQVALLTNGERRLSLAVLTRGNPTKSYGEETVRGVAERLLDGYS